MFGAGELTARSSLSSGDQSATLHDPSTSETSRRLEGSRGFITYRSRSAPLWPPRLVESNAIRPERCDHAGTPLRDLPSVIRVLLALSGSYRNNCIVSAPPPESLLNRK